MSKSQDSIYEYQVGGSLQADAPTYITRQADEDFYKALKEGKFCYVLNSRQMGKSSLRVQTMVKLQTEGIDCVVIQMTDIIEEEITPEQWYAGVINNIVMDLGLQETFDDAEWWASQGTISAVQRFSKFIREILLERKPGKIVIFIDEIDRIFTLKFSLDGFFAVIRECYNKRADMPIYRRLTFALIGVATPSDLIRDKRTTPFNIGCAINLTGFHFEEALPLAQGLEEKTNNSQELLKAILDWTGGQPFLTQKICDLIIKNNEHIPLENEKEWLDSLVREKIIKNWEAQDEPEHLRTIRDRILNAGVHTGRLIKLYQKILEQNSIEAEVIPDHIELQLSGLVVKHLNRLKVANLIYESVFNKRWIDKVLANLQPYAEDIEAWIASNYQDESKLLRGQALREALTWSVGKVISEQDYQFLADSQQLEIRNTKATLDQEMRVQVIGQQNNNSQKPDEEDIFDVFDKKNYNYSILKSNLYRQIFKIRNQLIDTIKYEVSNRLKISLYNQVLIDLRLQKMPSEVTTLWDGQVKTGIASPSELHNIISIVEAFDLPENAGKLLILGSPGSGKTTTLLELAQDLINRAIDNINYPLPILLNFSSWNSSHQSITDWLIEELKLKYSVPKNISKKWVEERQLLPLLDGLDEVNPVYQESCNQALNKWLVSESCPQYLVICSRMEEYVSLGLRLHLNSAILLKPLTNEQIRQYLINVDRVNFLQALQQDLTLLELIRTPLMLNMILQAYEEISQEQWQEFVSTKDHLQYLLDSYIRQILTREIDSKFYTNQKRPTIVQTRLWLVWLAQQMQRESQYEFLIEKMQPPRLKNGTHRQNYRLIFGLITGLGSGLIFGLSSGLGSGLIFGLSSGLGSGLIFGLIAGLGSGLIFGLIGGLIGGFTNEIKVVERLMWYWKGARKGLIFGLGGGLIFALIFALGSGLGGGLIFALIFGLGGGLIFGLGGGLHGSELGVKALPNQGVWQSAKNAGIFGLIGSLIGSLVGGLIGSLVGGLIGSLIGGLIGSLLGGLILGLISGGKACIQHFILRLVLYYNGYIPWNYARFLNYCTDRLLLQRVGGRYRFIHKLIQEHFAQMPLKALLKEK